MKSLFEQLLSRTRQILERLAELLRHSFQNFLQLRLITRVASLLGVLLIILAIFLFVRLEILRGDTFQAQIKIDPENSDDGSLRVVDFSPEGQIQSTDLKKEAVIVLNHPVVPLARLEETTTGAFTITPAVKGKFRWYGSRVSAFIPEQGYSPGTTYTIQVRKDLSALNGKKIQNVPAITFSTPPIKLNHTSPYKGSTIAYDTHFTLYFNYPIDGATVKKHTRLQVNDRSVGYRLAPTDRAALWTLIPENPLPRDASVILRLDPALSGSSSPAIVDYRTFGPLTVELKEEATYFQSLWELRFDFSSPVNGKVLRENVQLTPERRILVEDDQEMSAFSMDNVEVRPGDEIQVTFKSGLKDIYGNGLIGPRDFKIKIPLPRRSMYMDEGIAFIESQMKQNLPVFLSALPEVQARTGPFSLEQLQRYVEKDGNEALQFTAKKTFDWKTGVSAGQLGTVAFDASPYFADGNWTAVQLSAKVQDWEGKDAQEISTRFLQKTDLAFFVRQGMDGSHLYAYSLSSGEPVANAAMQVFDARKESGNCRTEKTGQCFVKHGLLSKPIFLATHKTDRAFMLGSNSVGMWAFSPHFESPDPRSRLTGLVLFDRRLYRPGETMYGKAFLAERRGAELLYGKSEVEARVYDSEGQELSRSKHRPSKEGGIDFQAAIKAEAPTGHYRVEISVPGRSDHRSSVSETFQVEEFRPATFAVNLEGLTDGRTGESRDVTLSGRYLFGASMQEAPYSYNVSRARHNAHHDRYSEYTFGDYDAGEDWDSGSFRSVKSGSGVLSNAGKATIAVPFTSFPGDDTGNDRVERSYKLELEASVSDRDEKTVSHRKSILVHPEVATPGIKVVNGFDSVGSEFTFDIVLATNDGSAGPRGDVTIVVVHKDWKSVQIKGPADSVQRKNTLIRTEVARSTLKAGPESVRFTYKPQRAGEFSIMAMYGRAYSRTTFYAWGGEAGYRYPDDNTLELIPEKNSYAPGQTARLLLKSPYPTAQAVITVEREKVLYQQSQTYKASEPILIPIKADYLPNVYVSVMLYRPRAKDAPVSADLDPGRPQMRMGMARIEVDSKARQLPLAISTDRSTYEPGMETTVNIQTQPGAEIALTVADRGVLDLIEYRYPDPLGIFYRDWPLTIQVYENLSSLVRQVSYALKGASPGGKGPDAMQFGDGGFSEDSEDGTRKDFRYTAHWAPTLKADAKGQVKLTFKLPHNLTTFRIMAVAALGGRYARASHEFPVARSVVLSPTLPHFLSPADRLSGGAVVINNSGKAENFRFRSESKGLKGYETTFRLEPFASREVSFPLELTDSTLDQIQGKFSIQSDSGASDAVSYQIKIKTEPVMEAFTIAGFSDPTASEELVIPGPGEIELPLGGLSLKVMSTALGGLEHGFSFFRSNPYFCLEQRSSAYLMSLAAGPLLEEFGQKRPTEIGYDWKTIETLFAGELAQFQNSDGGLRAWRENGPSQPYLSAYVLFVLQVAEENGQKGFSGKKKIIDYLKGYLKKPDESRGFYLLESLAFIHYVLSRENEGQAGLAAFLRGKKDQLSLRGQGYVLLSLVESGADASDPDIKAILQNFRNSMDVTTRRVSFKSSVSSGQTYNAAGSTLSVILQSFMAVNKDHPLIPGMVQHAVAQSAKSLWRDSHSSGQLAYALSLYRKLYEKEPEVTGTASLKGTNLLEVRLDAKKRIAEKLLSFQDLTGRFGTGSVPLQFSSRGRLYYTAALRYAPRLQKVDARDEGLEIRRSYYSLKNPSQEVTGPWERGQVYLARIQVTSPRVLYDTVVNDPLPANLEGVQSSFATESSVFARFLARKEQSGGWWMNTGHRTEVRYERIVTTQPYFRAGVKEYFYLVRPIARGEAVHPPAQAFAMYEPEIFGRTAAGTIVVR
ncbi:MAG: hypothetical protein HS115_02375 [Spirochaetales bacterium]|nr:hypothetical protein [Spirochaetales bacterium]